MSYQHERNVINAQNERQRLYVGMDAITIFVE